MSESSWSIQRSRDVLEGVQAGQFETESMRTTQAQRQVLRLWLAPGQSVVVKMWHGLGALRRMARQSLGCSGPWAEWRGLVHLHGLGVPVPQPLGHARSGRSEAVFMEDLGPTQMLIHRIDQRLNENTHADLNGWETCLIETTAGMVRGGVLDADHTVMNFVVPDDGVPRRVDLECARYLKASSHSEHLLATMLGRLVGSYMFAVQPHVDRVMPFAGTLVDRLRPSRHVLSRAAKVVQAMVRRQHREKGLDIKVDLPW